MKKNQPLILSYKPVIIGEKDFYDSIRKAIKTSEHKEALYDIIKEFETYRDFMSESLVSAPLPSQEVFQFRFNYQLKKNVWKDIEVRGDQTLAVLAEFLIDKMGWDNDHLDAFFFPEKKEGGIWEWYTTYEIGSDGVDNGQHPILHTEEVLVASVDYRKHPKIGFAFDFGDDHRFLMEYKGTRVADMKDTRKDFPKVVDERGIPPEQYPNYK